MLNKTLRSICVVGLYCLSAGSLFAAPPVYNLWSGKPPGDEALQLGPEADMTKPTDRLIAGKPVIRLGNVTTPTLTVYRPAKEKDTGAVFVICPGGGHTILAWDLEGTEVAEWLNTIGVTGVVVKYRVPARDRNKRWGAAVQDAQRAVSFVRSRAAEWGINPQRIGVLGFSAGGETAALTACFLDDRQYAPLDEIDRVSCSPNSAVLVYSAGVVEQDNVTMKDYIKVTEKTPPMFFAHAFDDRVRVEHAVQLYLALKKANVPSELHLYSTGGHGFGLRKTDQPCTQWPARCEEWLRTQGWLGK